MSRNLTVEASNAGGEQLYQTPTEITWMCLSYKPGTQKPDGGMEGVRRRYIHWCTYEWQHYYNTEKNQEEQVWIRETALEHIAWVESLKRPKFGCT